MRTLSEILVDNGFNLPNGRLVIYDSNDLNNNIWINSDDTLILSKEWSRQLFLYEYILWRVIDDDIIRTHSDTKLGMNVEMICTMIDRKEDNYLDKFEQSLVGEIRAIKLRKMGL